MNNKRIELQQTVNEALKGISQNGLANQAGVSAATLINIKRGEWEHISDPMVSKLRAFFRLDDWGIRKTHNFSVISQICDDARDNKRFMAVAGYTGAGKTTALEYYTRSNTNAFYVLADILHSKRTFIQSIQQALNISEGSSIREMLESIVRKLIRLENALLIIDDAGKLNDSCLRILQIIYDRTFQNAGLVLSGTEYLKTKIDRSAKKDVQGFRELKRRIEYWQPLRRPTKKVVANICQDMQITDSQAIAYIYEHAKDYGTLKNLVTNAMKAAALNGVQVTRELLIDVHVGDHAYESQTV